MERQELDSVSAEGTDGVAQVMAGLEANEMLAMTSLMRGETMTAAAKAAGVSRDTLYQWMKPGRGLHEAMRVWKQDFSETARTQLLMLTGVATANVARAMKDGDVKVSMGLLTRLGILGPPAVGPAHAETVAEGVRVKVARARRGERRAIRGVSFVEHWSEIRSKEIGSAPAGTIEMAEDGEG